MPLHSALAKLPARLLSWLRSYSSMVTLSPEKLDLCVYPLCQRSHLHVLAHVIFFCYSPVDNVLSPSRAVARETA